MVRGFILLCIGLSACGVLSPSEVACRTDDDCPAGLYCGTDQHCSASQSVQSSDSGPNDAGAIDAGSQDAGEPDAGAADAGAQDAGEVDAGATDAGAIDAGVTDAGEVDAGAADAGMQTDGGSDPLCAVDNGGCDANATCAVEWDSIVCSCNTGFSGDGYTCQEQVTAFSAGNYATCAIRSSGSLWCWGSNQYGELGDGTTVSRGTPVEVAPGTKWVAVNTNFYTTCGIQTDHSLWCWGRNEQGERGDTASTIQLVPLKIGIAKNWASVNRGLFHTCATRTDGSLWCWGTNQFGELGIGEGLSRSPPIRVGTGNSWASVSTGNYTTCALESTGHLWCWGQNGSSEAGTGGTDVVRTPTRVQDGGATWTSVSVGWTHTCGTRMDGTLWCWGTSDQGALGDGNLNAVSDVPLQVGTDTNWASVEAGGFHNCARKTFGSISCWGSNLKDQLADDFYEHSLVPIPVGTTALWSDVQLGAYHSCAQQTTGELDCWGSNSFGELGRGTTGQKLIPTQVDSSTGWVSVSAGETSACAIRSDGSLWCWGDNDRYQLGYQASTLRGVALRQRVNAELDWTQVSASVRTSCARKSDSTLSCWGANDKGQVGNGGKSYYVTPPAKVSGTTTWGPSFSAGGMHTCAIATNGGLWCWGDNTVGQLGSSGGTAPTVVGASTSWKSVTSGNWHTCATNTSNSLWCWGSNNFGQLGYSTSGGQQSSPGQVGNTGDWKFVRADMFNTFAIKTNGTLWAWGDNGAGRLGLGHANAVSGPTQVGTATTWESLSRSWTNDGGAHHCGVHTNGTLWCWGSNWRGGLGDGTLTDKSTPTQVPGNDWATVTAGRWFTCATKTNGTLWCWGDNDLGQHGDGTAWSATMSPMKWP